MIIMWRKINTWSWEKKVSFKLYDNKKWIKKKKKLNWFGRFKEVPWIGDDIGRRLKKNRLHCIQHLFMNFTSGRLVFTTGGDSGPLLSIIDYFFSWMSFHKTSVWFQGIDLHLYLQNCMVRLNSLCEFICYNTSYYLHSHFSNKKKKI